MTSTHALEHQTAQVNGTRLHYVRAGQGRPVMLLHGWPQTWYEWRQVVDLLAGDFTVIAPDLRGFGYSGKPAAGYDAETMAADLAALAQYLRSQPRLNLPWRKTLLRAGASGRPLAWPRLLGRCARPRSCSSRRLQPDGQPLSPCGTLDLLSYCLDHAGAQPLLLQDRQAGPPSLQAESTHAAETQRSSPHLSSHHVTDRPHEQAGLPCLDCAHDEEASRARLDGALIDVDQGRRVLERHLHGLY
jgi:hypothetical protein